MVVVKLRKGREPEAVGRITHADQRRIMRAAEDFSRDPRVCLAQYLRGSYAVAHRPGCDCDLSTAYRVGEPEEAHFLLAVILDPSRRRAYRWRVGACLEGFGSSATDERAAS